MVWKEAGDWEEGNPPAKADFLIVHKNLPDSARRCDPDNDSGFTESLEVSEYLGDEGRARLLSYLSFGPILNAQIENPRPSITDFVAFVDLFHRFQTPWYEEARRYFDSGTTREMFGHHGPIHPYVPDQLRNVVDENRREG